MRCIWGCLGLIVSLNAMSVTFPKGRGALLYDGISTAGPSGTQTADPGHWISEVQAFNTGANTDKKIVDLYPYAGDVELNCNGPTDCVYSGTGQNAFVYYDSGLPSIQAYHQAFPAAAILPIVDGNTKGSLLKALTYTQVGVDTAKLVVQQACSDPDSDGVFFDLEPFDISVPGQFAFYKEMSQQFSSSACIDANHPTGRVFGVFLSPNKVSDWRKVKAAFGQVGYAAVSAYDIQDTNPPVPTSLQAYHASVMGMLGTMDTASKTYNIPYKVVVPWAASFGEFNQYGLYDASNPPSYFKLIKDYTPEGITQLAYVQAARAIILAACKSPYYLGMDGWSWTQYKSPHPAQEQLVFPAVPEGEVVQYLQKN
ncbi:MAG: hypothetical protein K0U24_00710 [Gammaproteobacteria bacterium]|nr:hypothetical protein [Gammaproteobacteria bacterium]